VADELLGNRARAPAIVAGDLSLDGASDTYQVDAVMLIETVVLDGDECLRDVGRKCRQLHVRAVLTADFADEGPIAGQHTRRLRKRDDLPRFGSLGRGVLRDDRASRGEREDQRGGGE